MGWRGKKLTQSLAPKPNFMKAKQIKTPSGRVYFLPVFADTDALSDAVHGDDNPGFCTKCGEPADGVEPDARKYPCEACERNGVYGLEELLVMGAIEFEDEKEGEA